MACSSSSTLVNVDENAELRLVSLLAENAVAGISPTFREDCEKCIRDGNATELLATILRSADAVQSLLWLEYAEEAVSAFSLLAALLERVDRPEQEERLEQALAAAVVNATSNQAGLNEEEQQQQEKSLTERQITLLSVLFNMRSLGSEKCVLLRQMIQLAGQYPERFLGREEPLGLLLTDASTSPSKTNNNLTMFTSTTAGGPRLLSMMDAWQVPVSARRDVLETVAAVMPATDVRKQRFLLLLLESYAETEAVDERGLRAAKDAAVGAIRDPVSLFIPQRNMLSFAAVQALKQEHGVLLGLLTIFQQGKLSEYQQFVESHGGEQTILAPYGLDAGACTRHMRILSLCSLAAEQEEVPYSIIADTLQLQDAASQVETWVIAAVSSGLLEAKMDQLTQTVMVERVVVRQFDMEQWKLLQSRLRQWKQNVGGILAALKQQRQQQANLTSSTAAATAAQSKPPN